MGRLKTTQRFAGRASLGTVRRHLKNPLPSRRRPLEILETERLHDTNSDHSL